MDAPQPLGVAFAQVLRTQFDVLVADQPIAAADWLRTDPLEAAGRKERTAVVDPEEPLEVRDPG